MRQIANFQKFQYDRRWTTCLIFRLWLIFRLETCSESKVIVFISKQVLHLAVLCLFLTLRSSLPEVFCKKVYLKKGRCFPVNFAKFLRAPFFIEHLRWLLSFFADSALLSPCRVTELFLYLLKTSENQNIITSEAPKQMILSEFLEICQRSFFAEHIPMTTSHIKFKFASYTVPAGHRT